MFTGFRESVFLDFEKLSFAVLCPEIQYIYIYIFFSSSIHMLGKKLYSINYVSIYASVLRPSRAQFEVSSSHTTIFIADAPGSAGDGVFCIPSETGGQPCVFYLGVIGGGADEPPMHLTATVESPSGVSMVRVFRCGGRRKEREREKGERYRPYHRL